MIKGKLVIKKALKAIFGTKNDKELKKYAKRVKEINLLEKKYEGLSDEELQANFNEYKKKVSKGESLESILVEVFALIREASKRVLGMRHFDVQLLGGMVLHEGRIAEMKTGEGKTLVATLPVILNAMSGEGVHVVTVNDYLAARDAATMEPLYNFLGLSVGVVVSTLDDDESRQKAYACDITYGTNNEFGFDYLRDNMKYAADEKVQRGHNFVIVDEVDSILIDEARTPLVISGPTSKSLEGYIRANEVARQLKMGKQDEKNPAKISHDFHIDEKNRNILISEQGILRAEKLFGVDNLYSLDNAILAHQLDQALKAHHLFEKDVHYVIKDNEVIIVDEFTGRLSEGRRFSEGLHQALEAKENVKIQEESQTLADITFQNYFRMYKKLAGMTGTAQTEASEFAQIYSLDVVSIPTNVPINRLDENDLIYKSQKEKFAAVIAEIKKAHAKGQPVLVGTASIEKSEQLHELLVKEKIPHHVLNAKNHEHEALIIADAGKKGAVTIATNMAGRGVDIKIDDEIRSLGGLYIMGTERHESRRIDNQLRGRAGRQGDVGKSRFYLSLEDNLLRIFGGDKIKSIMERLGIEEGESIESAIVTRAVQNAQKKVESMHFEARKHLLEYDDVAAQQRKTIYKYRNELLDLDFDIRGKISQNIDEYIAYTLANHTLDEEGLKGLKSQLLFECGVEVSEESLAKMSDEELHEYLKQSFEKAYDEKMKGVDKEELHQVERILYLQILDNAWREHLYQMDILKTGIGLRGYNQKDPLVEYKKESYDLFMELVERIKFDSLKILFSISLANEEKEENAHQHEEEIAPKELAAGAKKPARNAPCPCGSGKKYKECCGKSGPKKGIFS